MLNMEEENEQLDYDEEELKNALKKAQQLKKLGEHEPKLLIQNSFLSNATKETRNNISSKCYINPKFAKQNIDKNAPKPNIFSAMSPGNVFNHQQSQLLCHQPRPNDSFLSQLSQFPPGSQLLGNLWQMGNQFSLKAPQLCCSTSQFSNVLNFQNFAPTIANNIYINPSVLNPHHNQSFAHGTHLQHQPTKSSQNWHLMVDDFVKKTISVPSRNYPRNRSSPSSSDSSLSTRHSTRSNSRASASQTQKRHRHMRHNTSQGKRAKVQAEEPQMSKQTIECAKAIGLGKDYLKKIEEQKKLREEIARKKSQHRKEIYARESRAEGQRNEVKEGTHDRESPPRRRATANRLRPYLAVVVMNLSGLDNPCRRVALIANKIGPVKKIWQETESNVHMIFEKHEDAKEFMQQYIGNSSTFGRVIDVIMKKVFLNTAAVF